MHYLILGNGQNEQVSDRFCPILFLGGGGGGGGEGGGGVNFGHAKSAVKKNSFVYVSMWLIFLLDNCLTNCLTYIHPYVHTYRHHSDQISRSAWTARLKIINHRLHRSNLEYYIWKFDSFKAKVKLYLNNIFSSTYLKPTFVLVLEIASLPYLVPELPVCALLVSSLYQ